jgi:hypothetical protein
MMKVELHKFLVYPTVVVGDGLMAQRELRYKVIPDDSEPILIKHFRAQVRWGLHRCS